MGPNDSGRNAHNNTRSSVAAIAEGIVRHDVATADTSQLSVNAASVQQPSGDNFETKDHDHDDDDDPDHDDDDCQ